jgi:limonene-1,2-epoxide hydrolase
MSEDPVSFIRRFCDDWSRLDTDLMMSYFAGEPTYHNMPGPPAVGTVAVRATIERFLSNWQSTTWDVVNVAAAGNVVFAERVDRTRCRRQTRGLAVRWSVRTGGREDSRLA